MIELVNVSKKFGRKKVLENVSCMIDNGVYGASFLDSLVMRMGRCCTEIPVTISRV